MKEFHIIVLLIAVVFTVGCVSENTTNLFKPPPTPTPLPWDCNGSTFTTFDNGNQTCCGNQVYTKLDGFVCWQDTNYKSIREIKEEEAFEELLRQDRESAQNVGSCYEDGKWAYYVCSDCACIE
jgi:hypothetical protein